MIVDKIENAAIYYSISPRIKKALKFLETQGLEKDAGVYEIEGKNIYAFAVEYTSKPQSESVFEAHKNYIDIQFIVRGSEQIGYKYLKNLKVAQQYDEDTDSLLLEGDGTMVDCSAGTFMILFPEDAHMPGVMADEPCDMKKVIVKVKV